MIRIGYFCTAGHTEAGGMQVFLARIEPLRATWERCFPAVVKPGPKLGRAVPKARAGLTGHDLVQEMLGRLAKYHRSGMPGALDLVVFIDDADCRFADEVTQLQPWLLDRGREVSAAVQNDRIPFVALFASPEVEAWLLADWEEGIGREHKRLSTGEKSLRAHVEELLGGPLDTVEAYGGGLVNGSCRHKLSERLQSLLIRLGAGYSKSIDGTALLRRIRPDKVADVCQVYFRPQWQKLVRDIHHLHAVNTGAALPPSMKPAS